MTSNPARAVRDAVRTFVRSRGFDVIRYDPEHSPHARRVELLESKGITVVLDVGANDGPYAKALRTAGYRGRIVSFEPQTDAYERLAASAAPDALWECHRLAAGAEDGELTLHVAGNSSSSSFLPMTAAHADAAPESRYIDQEVVPVRRLDGLHGLVGEGERAYLKVDVQGAELEALAGAAGILDRVEAIEAELSLAPLYDGAPLFPDTLAYLEERGFVLLSLEPVFIEPVTGRLLQLDGLFARPPRRA